MANKTLQEVGETIERVLIDLHCYKENMKHKAKIDCSNNHASFHHEGIEYFIISNEILQPISASVLMNGYNKGSQMFSEIMRNESSSKNCNIKNHEEISSVLDEYMDVLPEDLPVGLLKRTDTDFHIELKEDVKPTKKCFSRTSSTELVGIRKQVECLIEMGFVRPSKSPNGIFRIVSMQKGWKPKVLCWL